MHLINTDGILHFVSENPTKPEKDFLDLMSQYVMKANGANIHIYDKEDRLILSMNPFDGTQFICADDGYELAAQFGAKRFLMSEARRAVTEDRSKENGAIFFARDLTFPVSGQDAGLDYRMLTLAEVEHKFRRNKTALYVTLAELFNRCADFTPGKQDEYRAGQAPIDAQADKVCRFNSDANIHKNTPYSLHTFLADSDDKIAGTISASIIEGKDGRLDIYFYDEIVDYTTRQNAEEKATVEALSAKLAATANDDETAALKSELASLIEPYRTRMMDQLFTAARMNLRKVIADFDARVEKGLVHGFIRAAAGRVENYSALGCSKTNTENFVIHGQPTENLQLLKAHVKAWALEKLKAMAMQPKLSGFSAIGKKSSDVKAFFANADKKNDLIAKDNIAIPRPGMK